MNSWKCDCGADGTHTTDLDVGGKLIVCLSCKERLEYERALARAADADPEAFESGNGADT